MLPLTTTLTAIRAARPCQEGWAKLLGHLGKTSADDEPLPLTVILDSNGLDEAGSRGSGSSSARVLPRWPSN